MSSDTKFEHDEKNSNPLKRNGSKSFVFPSGILELAASCKGAPPYHCGHFRTLPRVIVMVLGALDESRIGGFERQHAMLCQIYRILESGAKDNVHDLVWGGPLLELSDPDARPDVLWSPAKASAVVARHRKQPHRSQQSNT